MNSVATTEHIITEHNRTEEEEKQEKEETPPVAANDDNLTVVNDNPAFAAKDVVGIVTRNFLTFPVYIALPLPSI